MLVIRKCQMHALNDHLVRRYEDMEVLRVRGRWPGECAALGEEGTRKRVRECIEKAAGSGICAERDIAVFVDLTFRFGSAFEDGGNVGLILAPVMRQS